MLLGGKYAFCYADKERNANFPHAIGINEKKDK